MTGKLDPNAGVPLDDVVLVFDESGALLQRLLHGPAIDQPLATEDASGDVLWLVADHQGTIRDVVQYDDISGDTTVVNHLQYGSFGQITNQTTPSKEPRHTYTGREWDADAELFYYRARWYDPVLGRFISEDPIGFAAGDSNITRYVENAPVTFTDPSGLSSSSDETGTPLPVFYEIGPTTGFPTTLPPVNNVTVVIAQRGVHTFLILLTSNGQTTYFRGGQGGNNDTHLVVDMGPYGTGAEPYYPDRTYYHDAGDVNDDNVAALTTLMQNLNAQNNVYGTGMNCNTTSCTALGTLGLPVPTTAIPTPPAGVELRLPPGWGER